MTPTRSSDLGVGEPAADFGRAADWVRHLIDEGPLPAAVLGAATSAGVVALEAFGASGTRTARVDDPFALYSVTKPLMALAALRAGVPLGERLGRILPLWGHERRVPVTLEHLLSHTSGLLEGDLDDARSLDEQLGVPGMLFEAGQAEAYSSLAFHGVARLVEERTGRDRLDQLADLDRFSTSSASDIGFTFDPSVDAHPVFGAAEIGLDLDALARHRHPGAGAFGTATGLLETGMAVLRGDVVAPETLTEMLRARTTGLPQVGEGVRKEYGLGWHLRFDDPGLRETNVFGHAGLSGTQWWLYPGRDLVFVLLTNLLDLPGHGVDADRLNDLMAP